MKSAMLPFLVVALGLAACAGPPTPAPTEPPTSTPTRTLVPSPTSTPAPTSTATPISTFAPAVVSNPATEVVDARVVVQGENLKVIFYMRDVPTELPFQREGIRINYDEYTWQVCVDTDNDKTTGMPSAFVEGAFESGADHCLAAMNFRRDVAPQTAPIEEGVQVNVWATSAKSMKVISEADLEVDPMADTLTLSGVIPGITEESLFYYYTLDRNPGGKPQVQGGQLLDRVSFE